MAYALGPVDSSRHNLRRYTLARAALLVGGQEALRRRLSVSALVLAAWMSGAQTLPTDVFLKAVDIVEDEMVASIKKRGGSEK